MCSINVPAQNVINVVVTTDTCYVLTGTQIDNITTGEATTSSSQKEGKLYAIKCKPPITSSTSTRACV